MSLVGIGTPPPPLSPASVPLDPNKRGKGTPATRLRARGWGSPNSDDWRKSLALRLLCVFNDSNCSKKTLYLAFHNGFDPAHNKIK